MANGLGFGQDYNIFRKASNFLKLFATGAVELAAKSGQNITLTGNAIVHAGRRVVNASTTQVVVAGTSIQPDAEVVQISSSGDVTMTSTPTIADGVDGQEILLINRDTTDSITIQDNGTLANSGLELTGTTLVLGPLDNVRLRYISALDKWVQVGPLVNVA
jgi:hypothetical protein